VFGLAILTGIIMLVAGLLKLGKLPDGGRLAAFSEALLAATSPEHAVAFVQSEDRFRDLSAMVEEAWMAMVGAENF
jgi:hypothetical protein